MVCFSFRRVGIVLHASHLDKCSPSGLSHRLILTYYYLLLQHTYVDVGLSIPYL